MELPDEFSEANGWHVVGYLERDAPVFTYQRWLVGDPAPMSYTAPRGTLQITAEWLDPDPDLIRILFDIPPGFPLWYIRPQLALTVGPIGRLIQSTQCRCGHVELQHIILLDECLGGCDCARYIPRTPPVQMGWHERLVRAIRNAWGWM